MPRRKKIVPGVGEGHPDDRPGPTYDSIKETVGMCLEEAYEAGASMIVGLGITYGPDALGCRRPARWYINSVGDYMSLTGLARQIQRDVEESFDYADEVESEQEED